jgi:hypothetical protein
MRHSERWRDTLSKIAAITFFTPVFLGIRDTAISRFAAWIPVFELSYMVAVPRVVILISLHGYLFQLTPFLWMFLRSMFHVFSGDGPLNDKVGEAMLSGGLLLSYITTSLLFHNIGTARSYLGAILKFSIPVMEVIVIEVISPGILLWYLMLDNPTESLHTELLPALRRIGNVVLSRALTSIRLGIKGFYLLLDALDRTGLFFDVDPAVSNLHKYEYENLTTDRHIRLLEISRQYPFGPIRCEIISKSLDERFDYESISYAWGDKEKTHKIKVGNCQLAVTANAFEIIRDRAFFLKTRLIWIDAICINQTDETEKSGQIQLMRTIYRQASWVIVWLGNAPDATEAMRFISRLYAKMHKYDLSNEELKSILAIGSQSPGWPAFCHLLGLPYWTRVWIIQEVAVASNVYISYGGESMTWEFFISVLRGLYREGMGSVFVLSEVDHIPQSLPIQEKNQIYMVADIRDRVRSKKPISFRTLLHLSLKCEATVRKDKIFAIRGIADEHAQQAIAPKDYELGEKEVYILASRYLLYRNDPFDLLNRAGIGYRREISGLPSWVVDWSSPPNCNSLWREPGFPSRYRASGSTNPNVRAIANSTFITVTGHITDEIEDLAPVFLDGTSLEPQAIFAKFPVIFQATCRLARLSSKGGVERSQESTQAQNEIYLPSRQPLREAFWRTLIGDTYEEGTDAVWPAPGIYSSYFSSFDRMNRMLPTLLSESAALTELLAFYPDCAPERPEDLLARMREDEKASGKFARACASCGRGRRLARTRNGYLAMVPPLAQKGDLTAVLLGGQSCFILRREGELGMYKLVGDAYVHGMMDGEALEYNLKMETFVIT